jgi:glucan-binding YG repeat protein
MELLGVSITRRKKQSRLDKNPGKRSVQGRQQEEEEQEKEQPQSQPLVPGPFRDQEQEQQQGQEEEQQEQSGVGPGQRTEEINEEVFSDQEVEQIYKAIQKIQDEERPNNPQASFSYLEPEQNEEGYYFNRATKEWKKGKVRRKEKAFVVMENGVLVHLEDIRSVP